MLTPPGRGRLVGDALGLGDLAGGDACGGGCLGDGAASVIGGLLPISTRARVWVPSLRHPLPCLSLVHLHGIGRGELLLVRRQVPALPGPS